MATITGVVTKYDDGSLSVLWETLTNTNNNGSFFTPPSGYGLDLVLMQGTFGAAVVVEASPDGTNSSTAEDVGSAAASLTAKGTVNMGGAKARAWRPLAGAVTDVDVIAFFSPRA